MSRRRLVAILALGVCSALPGTARAGSYDVLSCTIDGRFYPNNAWSVVATNAPQYRVDPVCSQPGDPMVMSLAPENGFGAETLAGLIVFAPPNTVISNWTVRIHHFWYAPGYLNPDGTRQPDETTYVGLGMIPGQAVSGAGQWDPNQQAALQPDGRWYGLRQPGSAGAVDTNTIAAPLVEHKSDTAVARSINNATQLGASAGCSGIGGNCELGPEANVTEEVYGSRITITDDVPPTLTSVSTGGGLMAPGLRTGGEPITFSATDNVGVPTSST